MTKIKLDPRMTFQIDSIYTYISENLSNEPAAYKLQHMIKRKISSLATFPNSGTTITTLIDNVAPRFSSVRRLNANDYVILYAYFEKIDIVLVTHIFHQTQNYGRFFKS